MIEEDFVSFDTAKLLKEKGFNEKCSHLYTKKGGHLFCGYAKLTELSNSDIDEATDFVKDEFECTCPTLQRALKWLWLEHDILVLVDKCSGYYRYEFRNVETDEKPYGNGLLPTPEEAKEYALLNYLTTYLN